MIQSVNAKIDILNVPDSGIRKGFYVVRAERTALGVLALWYYGPYEVKERAEDVASSLGNGLVIEVTE